MYVRSEMIRTNRVEAGSRYSILQDGTLMIENAREADEGVYECVARNQLGEVKADAVELRYLDDTRPGARGMHAPAHLTTHTAAARRRRSAAYVFLHRLEVEKPLIIAGTNGAPSTLNK